MNSTWSHSCWYPQGSISKACNSWHVSGEGQMHHIALSLSKLVVESSSGSWVFADWYLSSGFFCLFVCLTDWLFFFPSLLVYINLFHLFSIPFQAWSCKHQLAQLCNPFSRAQRACAHAKATTSPGPSWALSFLLAAGQCSQTCAEKGWQFAGLEGDQARVSWVSWLAR